MNSRYSRESWCHSSIYLDSSPIHGKGLFSTEPIAAGTIVIKWGGEIFTEEDIRAGRARQHTYVGIDDKLYLGTPVTQEASIDDYMNHSCDGNVWMLDEVTLVARRIIPPGEEIVADYALWLNRPEYRMKNDCNCGASLCRRSVTGVDWKKPDLQSRYQHHFSPFINRLIATFTG